MPCLLVAPMHHEEGSHDTPRLLASSRQSANASLQGKAGMEFLVRVAARLYAKKGINCNAIIPGLVLAGETDAKSPWQIYLPSTLDTHGLIPYQDCGQHFGSMRQIRLLNLQSILDD